MAVSIKQYLFEMQNLKCKITWLLFLCTESLTKVVSAVVYILYILATVSVGFDTLCNCHYGQLKLVIMQNFGDHQGCYITIIMILQAITEAHFEPNKKVVEISIFGIYLG